MRISIIIVLVAVLFNSCLKEEKPNIIYIYTDQQSATMMSCAGNKYLKTPVKDYIANNNIRFTRAYTTNPVCSPARVSMMTGRFPGYFKGKKDNIVRNEYTEQAASLPCYEIYRGINIF